MMPPIGQASGLRSPRTIPGAALAAALIVCLSLVTAGAQTGSPSSRESLEQPDKVMEVTGLAPGMVVGEIGAGHGYFTFRLARQVGLRGKVYANDIDHSALRRIEQRCIDEDVTNVETVLGVQDDPRFPSGALDMVYIFNAFHEFTEPVELLANLLPSLKPGATVVVMDRDASRAGSSSGHFKTRAEMEKIIGRSVFELVRVETFLRDHNLYIIKART